MRRDKIKFFWMQRILIVALVAYCLFYLWMIREAYHSYSVATGGGSPNDTDLRIILRSVEDVARSWTAIIAVLGFFAGIAAFTIYHTLRHDLVRKTKTDDEDPTESNKPAA